MLFRSYSICAVQELSSDSYFVRRIQNFNKLKKCSRSWSLLLQVASELSQHLPTSKKVNITDLDLKTMITSLSNSLILIGKVSQSLNQFRRQLLKWPVSGQYTKLDDRRWLNRTTFQEFKKEFLEGSQNEDKMNAFLKDIQPKLHQIENKNQQTIGYLKRPRMGPVT